jgi:hypothetical protein
MEVPLKDHIAADGDCALRIAPVDMVVATVWVAGADLHNPGISNS